VLTLVPFGSELYRQTLAFRDKHLRRPLGLAQSDADLAGEDAQIHIAWVMHGQVEGTVVLKPARDGVVKLRQMAVGPALQGQGIGCRLVRFAEAAARERGFARVEMHARVTARPFYERLGYEAFGPEFEEVTVPHIAMARDF
jgi:predicted N-acetyltransferase YhbS